MCAFEIPVFKYISKLWTERGYSLVAVLGFSELVLEQMLSCHLGIPKQSIVACCTQNNIIIIITHDCAQF